MGIHRASQWVSLKRQMVRDLLAEDFLIGSKKPSSVAIAVTDRCNLRCPTCSKWTTGVPPAELTPDAWGEVFRQVREWLGPVVYTISGGEPALRTDLAEIIRRATTAGLVTNLLTNGSACQPGRWEEFVAAGVKSVGCSLNALTPALHNRSRGSTHSYAQIMNFLEMFRGLPDRPTMCILAIMYPANAHEMPALARWAAEQGYSFLVQPLIPFQLASAYGANLPGFQPKRFEWSFFERGYAELWEGGTDAIHAAIDELLQLKAQGLPVYNPADSLESMRRYFCDRNDLRPCGVSWKNIEVDPYGYVRICFALQPIGHLAQGTLCEIWTGAVARERRKEVHICEKPCRLLNCNRN